MSRHEVIDDYLHSALERHSHWIAVADAKAGALLVTVPALLALYGSTLVVEARMQWQGVRDWGGFLHEAMPLAYLLLVACTAVAGLKVIWHAFKALEPRVSKPYKRRGMVFFGDIANEGFQAYEAGVFRLGSDELRKDYIEQVHTTARITDTKFEQVQRSLRWAVALIILSIAAYLPSVV